MAHLHFSRIWVGRIVAAIVMAVLGIYLLVVGLDRADKIASALSVLVAIAALVMPYLTRSTQASSVSSLEQGTTRASTQSVINAVTGGHLTQVRDVRDIQLPSKAMSTAVPETMPQAKPEPDTPHGQYVNGVWVGGNLTQIDGTDGDVILG